MNTIGEAVRPGDPDTGWHLPSEMNARDYFDLLVHRGALQIGRSGESSLYSCPIPSLREFLIGRGERGGDATPGP